MSAISTTRVYRSRSQSFGLAMLILANDVLIGAGVARNTDRAALVVFGITWIVLFTVIGGRAAAAGIFASPSGIHVRNVFSNSDFRWDEIERFEIDAEKGWFPRVCRIYTKSGRIKRVFGIQETNVAMRLPMEQRPAAKIVSELNEALANPEKRGSTTPNSGSMPTADRPSSI